MASHGCWLVCDGHVLASAEQADDRAARRRGLMRRDAVDGAFVIPRCRWVHTFGMRFALDVAHLDESGNVLRTVRMVPNRLGAPMLHARTVVEAEAGAFARWGLRVGDVLEVRQ